MTQIEQPEVKQWHKDAAKAILHAGSWPDDWETEDVCIIAEIIAAHVPTPAPFNSNDTVEYWKSRAETAELKVLTFHEEITKLGVGSPAPTPTENSTMETVDHSPLPWTFSNFTKPDGSPMKTPQDVADTVAFSATKCEGTELWGVTLDEKDEDGRTLVICYTGNGPHSEANARLIVAAVNALNITQPPAEEAEPGDEYRLDQSADGLLKRIEDYRTGYSCGYSDAKNGTRIRDKDAAAQFFSISGVPDVGCTGERQGGAQMSDIITGTCPHGKLLFAAVNEPDVVKDYAKDIADMVQAGFSIGHTERLVKLDGGCDQCCKK